MRALSSRGASLQPARDCIGPASVYVIRGADEAILSDSSRHFAADVVRSAATEGYIVSSEGPGFVLSQSGRAVVRRLRSTSETADAATGPSFDSDLVGHISSEQRPDSPLGWLRMRKDKDGKPLISDVEFAAGERLRWDYERALEQPGTTVRWSQSADLAQSRMSPDNAFADRLDRTLAARSRVERALEVMDDEVARIVVDVCCHGMGLVACEKLRGLTPRSAKYLIGIGLRALAGFYGLSNRRYKAKFDAENGQVHIGVS